MLAVDSSFIELTPGTAGAARAGASTYVEVEGDMLSVRGALCERFQTGQVQRVYAYDCRSWE